MRRGLPAAVVPTEEGMFKVCWLLRPESLDVVVYQTGTHEQLARVLTDLMVSEQPAIRRVQPRLRDGPDHVSTLERGVLLGDEHRFEGLHDAGRLLGVRPGADAKVIP